MYAVKGNREYKVTDENQKNKLLAEGYDIYDKGKIVAHAKGKTVDYTKYEAVVNELETLKAEHIETLKELEALKAEGEKSSKSSKSSKE